MALLFCYGSLRRDLGRLCPADGRAAAARLHRDGRFVAQAWTRGRLIAPDWYPGLIAGRAQVRGEIWRADERLLAFLDAYEGEDYARRRVLTRLASGRSQHALAWVWIGDAHGPAIPSGDYRAWLRSPLRHASPHS